jgi:hypothetical protein
MRKERETRTESKNRSNCMVVLYAVLDLLIWSWFSIFDCSRWSQHGNVAGYGGWKRTRPTVLCPDKDRHAE